MEWVFLGLAVLIIGYFWFVAVTFGVLFRRPIVKKAPFLKPLFGKEFSRHLDKINATINHYKERPFEEVKIASSGLQLYGRLYEKESAKKIVIFVHGYYSSGLHDIGYIGTLYEDLNISLLIIDQRSTGESEGLYTTFGALERFDIREWIFYLNARYKGEKEIYLHGVSMGAASSLLVTSLNGLPDTFKGVIADCGYSRTNGVILHAGKKLIKIRPRFTFWAVNLFVRFFAGCNLSKVKVSKELRKNTAIPILFIHGTADNFVPFNMSIKNFKACNAKKKFVAFSDAQHCEAYLSDEALYTKEVREFLDV